ncbi:MAG: TonB-dependent receptor [Candidatus Eisenbacteria bacterium]|nr:TonB-dependent receptor [Candidatus Eisenbacteria bacterium]MBU1949363.1 TonB-dependent receptor [Candidatus Eisenbacteria bacterium]
MSIRSFGVIGGFLLTILISALGVGTEPLWAGEPHSEFDDFSELDLDALLNSTVITASKYAQKSSESPVSVSIITAEQIAASGARSIPELLLSTPGLEVITNTASCFDVSARGLNTIPSNNMLVMIDGRSVYADFYGMTLWEFLPVSLEEIRSIEIIKGPGSALYGANAFAGVINIITYKPGENDATILNVKASHVGEELSSFVHGNSYGPLSWKLSGGWETTQNWETEYQEEEMSRFNGEAIYRLNDEASISLFTGNSNGFMNMSTGSTIINMDGQYQLAGADLRWKNVSLRYFWTEWHLDGNFLDLISINDIGTLDNGIHDVEFQHSFSVEPSNFVLWGGNFRRKEVKWTLFQNSEEQNLHSAFLYDEWRPRGNLLFSLGVRYDDHPLVGEHIAPRGGIVYKPHENHALRLTYGEAYRDPTFLESYGRAEIELIPTVNILVHGNEALNSEEIRSLELGYQGLLTKNVLGSVALYRNRIREVVQLSSLAYFPAPPFPEGIPSEFGFTNKGGWDIAGVETSLDALITEWMKTRFGYSYIWAEDKDTGDRKISTPRHTLVGELILMPHAIHSISLMGRYRSATEWDLTNFNTMETEGPGDEYFVMDARWRIRPRSRGVQAIVGVDNILDRRYRDHPWTIEFRRRIYTSLCVEF